MSLPDLGATRAVADRLDGLGLEYAFVGGSIVNLLLDDPTFAPARPTDDVDVIVETATSQRYSDVEGSQQRLPGLRRKLRAIGSLPSDGRAARGA